MQVLTRFSLVGFLGLISFTSVAQNAPLKNFDAFCKIFEENYATFEIKGIDWKGDCWDVRSTITKNTTDPELFTIMKYLLSPLNDAHTSLKAKNIDSTFSASRESRIMKEIASIDIKERRPKFRAMTEATLSANGFVPISQIGPEFKDEKLFSFTKNETTGYLRFMRSFSTLINMKGGALDKQLDQIFASFEGLEFLIIDIRFNIGGDDGFSQRVAGYLVNKSTVGFHKQTMKKEVFQRQKTKMIKPSKNHHFAGKVALLTNDKSVSAADVLALMLYDLPQVTIIGENSNGSYSDLYNRRLPNGWALTLSNQRYFSAVEQENFEGMGTPVTIEVQNSLSDIEKQHDSVLLAALEHLKK